MTDRAKWLAGFIVLAMLGYWAGQCYQFDPGQGKGLVPCVFNDWTHLYCPGCGGQRAVHHLLHGLLLTAARCNALFFLLVPMLLIDGLGRLRGVKPTLLDGKRLGQFIAVFVIAFFVARNLPFWPWSLLTPPT